MKVTEAARLAGSKEALAKLLGVTGRAVQLWGEEMPQHRYYQLRGMYAAKVWKPIKGQAFPK